MNLDDLKSISPLAQIAFASRCARRIEPVFTSLMSTRRPKDCEILDRAIAAGEMVGARHEVGDIDSAWQEARDLNKSYYVRVFGADNPTRKTLSVAAYVARSALHFKNNRVEEACESVREAILNVFVVSNNIKKILDAVEIDLDNLLRAMHDAPEGQEEAYSKKLFGELWSEGTPDGWPNSLIIHDVFISHASQDKDPLVRELVGKLRVEGYAPWYDESNIDIGESIVKAIDQGLLRSRCGLVVFSDNFFARNWPRYELDGIVIGKIHLNKKIVPIWYGVDFEDVARYSQSLAALNAIKHKDIDSTVHKIKNVLEAPIR